MGGGNLSAAGASNLPYLLENLSMGSSSGSGETPVLDGLVPDGIASVTALYPGHTRLDALVHNNFWALSPPRKFGDSTPHLVIWRRADGSAARTFPHGRPRSLGG